MSMKDDGGLAFPRSGSFHETGPACYDSSSEDGMSLRDYFAAKVFAAAVSAVAGKDFDEAYFAKTAYVCADAMLAARSA